MSDWNSSQYLQFEEQRTRPAKDLLARLAAYTPHAIADIGCGPGNSTAAIAEVFPNADIIGIDTSPNMIARAQANYPDMRFMLGDAADLDGSYDLLFSNACLQWIPDHATLIPSLMKHLNEHGILAVQIPMNGEEPLFQIIKGVAAEPRWGLRNVQLQPNETRTPAEYFDILSGCSSSFNLWEVKYYHNLPDHKSLVEWVKGTRIRPYLDHLSKEQGEAFENAILERCKAVYPKRSNGEVVLGFRRLFFTAAK